MKIVINRCYGGFGLSDEARQRINELGGIFDKDKRDDPILVRVVEEMGEIANGEFSKLKVVEIPDNVEWEIEDYAGVEWVSEVHRTWGRII